MVGQTKRKRVGLVSRDHRLYSRRGVITCRIIIIKHPTLEALILQKRLMPLLKTGSGDTGHAVLSEDGELVTGLVATVRQENLTNSQFSSIDKLNFDECLDSSKVLLVQ